MAVGSWQLAVGSWQLAVGGSRFAVRSWQQLFCTKRQEVPPEAAHPGPRQRVESPHEEGVEQQPLPSAVQARLHRKPFLDQADVAKAGQQRAELAGAVTLQHR